MSTHSEFDLLSAYMDGELDAADRTRVEEHLSTCGECSEVLAALRATMTERAGLEEPAPPAQQSWALRAAITKARGRGRERFARAAMAMGGVAAVILGFVVFAGGGGLRSGGGAQELSAGAPAMTVGVDDYDAAAARALISTSGTGMAEDSAEVAPVPDALTEAPADAGRKAKEPAFAAGGTAPTSDGEDGIDWREVVERCSRTVFDDAQGSYAWERAFGARYEGAPALFMIFFVSDDNGQRRELWVVTPDECELLFFAQERA